MTKLWLIVALVAHLGAGFAAAQLDWRPRADLYFRRWPALSENPSVGRVLLFGGEGLAHSNWRMNWLDDTWEWDGRQWQRRWPAHVPGGRLGSAMAPDATGQPVLFGGQGFTTSGYFYYGDTWRWDGRDWIQLVPAVSPSARAAHAMAYDPRRKRTVLYGGRSSETWEWDGQRWLLRTPVNNPGGRIGPSMAFNPRTGRIVLFGGLNNPPPVGTWEWDGNDWLKVPTTLEPTPRTAPGLVTDPVRASVMLYGGDEYGSKDLTTWADDQWEWDGQTWRLLAPKSTALYRSMGWTVSDGWSKRVIRLFSFDYGRQDRDTHLWDGSKWTKGGDEWQVPTGPWACAYDAARALVVTCGAPGDQQPSGPFETLVVGPDDSRFHRVIPANSPPSRVGYVQMAYHAEARKLVLFGGYGPSSIRLTDTWLWNGTTWTEHKSTVQPGSSLYGRTMVYDSWRGKIVLTCTRDGSPETWEWDEAQGWKQWAGSTPKEFWGLAYDSRRRVVVGVKSSYGPVNAHEIWEWDTTSWRRMSSTQTPPHRDFHGFEYVPFLGGTLLFGGAGGDRGAKGTDTWLWDGKDWSKLAIPDLPVDQFAGARGMYDSARQRLVALNYVWAPRPVWDLSFQTLSATQPYPRPAERLSLQASLPTEASRPFLMALSRATWPGIPLRAVPGVGVEILPLAADDLLALSLQAGFVTALDAQGRGTLPFVIPNDTALVWLDLFAAGVTFRPAGGIGAITNSVAIKVVP